MFSEASFTHTIRKVAIVGSGLAGLTLGHELQDRGYQVRLFDKARGPGGRMSSKRAGEQSVDMGAQYFTIRQQGFKTFLDQKAGADSYGIWEGQFEDRDEAGQWHPASREARYIGIPRMSAITRALAADLDITTSHRVVRLEPVGNGQWRVLSEAGNWDVFDAVLMTAPVQQCRDLLKASDRNALAMELSLADYELQPCWAVALQFGDEFSLPVDGGKLNHPVLGWIANNSSKEGRNEPDEDNWWVLHATADWSDQNRDSKPEDVIRKLKETFQGIMSASVEPKQSIAHRWLYAKAGHAGAGSLWWPGHRLGIAGDWLNGGRVEAAWESASDLAGRLTGSAPDRNG